MPSRGHVEEYRLQAQYGSFHINTAIILAYQTLTTRPRGGKGAVNLSILGMVGQLSHMMQMQSEILPLSPMPADMYSILVESIQLQADSATHHNCLQ